MAAMSKREQARNERELQDLLRQPGNSTCADCAARNPAWASWNLGIFLCMRCASIHRKLGTHISKVKSLSMDKWTGDQIEGMKQHGNIASNKHYNPKNKQPDIPLDADEVDSAMERFIRKKYQEKSLVDGRPQPPSRLTAEPNVSPSLTQTQSPQQSPNPDLPVQGKKHKFFGFSLRTSSKKDRLGVDNAFKITPVEYSPTSGHTREVSDRELQEKLAQLRDMGFPDNERNLTVLKRSGGDIERTIALLVKLGPSEPSRKQSPSPAPVSQMAITAASSSSAPPTATMSNNPFDQIQRPQAQGQQSSGFGLSFDAPQQQSQSQPGPAPNANPWSSTMPSQQTQSTGLEHQFSGMQVSSQANTLFPHHTGGYSQQPAYQHDPRFQTMTPPIPSIPQHYGYTSSPTSNTSNPFYQQPLSSQSTGNNPFLQQQQSQPVFAPTANPFLGMQQSPNQTVQATSSNPFGLPPSQQQPLPQQFSGMQYTQPQQQQQPQSQQSTNPFGFPSTASSPPIQNQQSQTFPQTQQSYSNPFGQPQQQSQFQPQSSQSQTPNFNYGQPQQQPQQQTQQFLPQSQQTQPQPLQPQATGRYTNNDILAMFSQPNPYQTQQQQKLAPVQETYDGAFEQGQQQTQPSLSPAPLNSPFGGLSPGNSMNAGKRSVTMPAPSSTGMSSMHSSGGIGNRNPFMMNQQVQQTQQQSSSNPFGQPQAQTQLQSSTYGTSQGWTQGVRHASNESVSVNNQGLMDGRHSPDAFASLSARY